jgi:hypothetical protein
MDDVAGNAIGSLCARCHSFRLGRNVTIGALAGLKPERVPAGASNGVPERSPRRVDYPNDGRAQTKRHGLLR